MNFFILSDDDFNHQVIRKGLTLRSVDRSVEEYYGFLLNLRMERPLEVVIIIVLPIRSKREGFQRFIHASMEGEGLTLLSIE